MLSEYIKAYINAMKNNDKKAMSRIEKDLAKLGMDKATLMIVVREEMGR